MQKALEFYARNGYLVVPEALSAAEVSDINAAIDRDLVENRPQWQDHGNGRLQSVHALLAQPALDVTMRPPRLLPLLEAIFGDELCADEHSVMIRQGDPPALECHWHRDTASVGPPPYFTNALSVVFYLTDVEETGHTFSVIPGSAQSSELQGLDAYDLNTAQYLTGPAGTAILFNAAIFHAGCVRATPQERRTVHIYCGRNSVPSISNYTIFPRRLWEGQDAATRQYYRRLNPITHLLRERF